MKFTSTKAMIDALKHYIDVDLSYGENTRRFHGGVIVETKSLDQNKMRRLLDFEWRTGAIEVEQLSAWQTLVHRTV